jgi:hypothetical protein
MKFQRQLSNGRWIDIDEAKADNLIAKVIERESWFADRQHREPMATHKQVKTFLATGETIKHGSDWYSEIRMAPQPREKREPEMVRCDCGHSCERGLVMSTSTGTSCPDCYDRMSL